MVKPRRLLTAALLCLAATALSARAADAHPLHTTLTELAIDPSRHTVRAVVRVFADDLAAALAHQQRGAAAAMSASALEERAGVYVTASLSIVNGGTTPIALHPCGVRRNADLLWVCVEGTIVGEPRELTLRNSVLCDVFADQVNIVQVGEGANKHSLLFTRGDRAKRLP